MIIVYVIDRPRWIKSDKEWEIAAPLLKEVLGYTDDDIRNFIEVFDRHWFPPFALNVNEEQIPKILQPFADYELDVFVCEYDDNTLKLIDVCSAMKKFGIVYHRTPQKHYYDEPVISESQKVDPLNPPTFDKSWVELDFDIKPVSTQPTNVPKCPTCQSTNIRKMGSVERGASILTWGIFSKKINKTFKCNNCGHTW